MAKNRPTRRKMHKLGKHIANGGKVSYYRDVAKKHRHLPSVFFNIDCGSADCDTCIFSSGKGVNSYCLAVMEVEIEYASELYALYHMGFLEAE